MKGLLDTNQMTEKQMITEYARISPKGLPVIESLWTADGRYLIVHDMDVGPVLVRPRPWQVIPLGKRIYDHFGDSDRPTRIPGFRRTCGILPQPTPGWVTAFVNRTHYAVDYEGQKFVRLGKGVRCVLSPDGKRVAFITRQDKVVVKDINLPIPQPATRASAAEREHGE